MTALRTNSGFAKSVSSSARLARKADHQRKPNLSSKTLIPAAVAGAAVGLAAGTAAGTRLAPRGELLGVRLRRRPSLGDRCTDAACGALGTAVKGGRVVQRLTAIENELYELRASARPAQRRSPIEVLISALTRPPGEPR